MSSKTTVRGFVRQIGRNIVLDFSEPAVWWYITRASAIVAWVLLTLSALWGILLKTRILRGADNPDWLKVVHRFISSLAMLMVITHVVSLWMDSYIEFTVADLLIPFASSFEPLAVALGVIAMWVMVIVWITSVAMPWLPQGVWKAIHFTSYLSLFAVALHSGMVGSDVGTPWYTALSLVLVTAATLAGVIRVVLTKRAAPQARSQERSTEHSAPVAAKSLPSAKGPDFVARVVARHQLTPSIVELTLTPVDQDHELDWDVGAHVTLHLGNGTERQYSLVGDPADNRSLRIAVLNTGGPGGGSQWIHDHVRVGMELGVDGPIQAFPLKAHHRYQFVASGIGITPLRAMTCSLPAGREWELVYLGRTREDMAYLEELEEQFPGKVRSWVSAENGRRASIAELIDPAAHVYACGSEGVLSELEKSVAPDRLHLERFSPVDRSAEHNAQQFSVTWEPTGQTIEVAPESTVLESLESAGVSVNASCRRGVCGSCELRVIDGEPAHMDSVMSDDDKDEVGVMYPCVSRAKGGSLTVSV